MHFSTILLLAGSAVTDVNGLALEEPRNLFGGGSWGCPSQQPNYCGWYDSQNNQPPCCKAPQPKPQPHPKPSCPSGKVPYCAKDPGHFCPYDSNHAYCQDDGTTKCDCYDQGWGAPQMQHELGQCYSPIGSAYGKLGSNCLCKGICLPSWGSLSLGCSSSELLSFTSNGIFSVVGGLLGGWKDKE